MKTLSSDKKVRRIAENAVFIVAALMLSFVESIIPIAVLPIPGFKLGLSNIAVTVAAYRLSIKDAAGVSFGRIILTFFIFGNPTALIFSIFGALLSVFSLYITKNSLFLKKFSFIGISVLCAVSHNLGQLTAALRLIGISSLGYTLPLIAASLVYGTLNGIILNLIPDKIYQNKNRTEGSI